MKLSNYYRILRLAGHSEDIQEIIGYHAATKGEFTKLSVDIGSDADIMAKGFYFATDKEYAARYGEPREYKFRGKFATTEQWVAALKKYASKGIEKQRRLAKAELMSQGYQGVISGNIGVVWDERAFSSHREFPGEKE
jgi:hypothetical protein